ncbi:MAG: RlmE family RNA methyltransferase [Candidatus Adiutrix sp.]|jgi:23S rRNA (uridine2552-2'-O)-methyltransferase|nr:RlmE family RNA methyltransferase [Candidatus Adiutrix sp.]
MTVKDRQRLDDHYSRQARKQGFPARSVYKLEEIDQRFKLFKPGQRVLDLGCAPGSWSLYAAARVGERGRVVGLDLTPVKGAFPPQVKTLTADLLDNNIDLVAGEAPFDLVLSDMAPKTSGRREVDQSRSLELCRMAWLWAGQLLHPSGHFLFKIFQSQEGEEFIKSLQPYFSRINRLKPKATRSQSLEIFVLGQVFHPDPAHLSIRLQPEGG